MKLPKCIKLDHESGGTSGNTKRCPLMNMSFFTFNNYDEKDIDALIFYFGSNEYIFQEELGEKGTRHLQGCVNWVEGRVRPSEKINYTKDIHWEIAKNWEASKRYCCKLESRCGEIYHNIPLPILPKSLDILKANSFYHWQCDIIEIIKGEPSNRLIYWYWEPNGNAGKSTFAKYLCYHYNAIVLSGKGADMKYGVMKFIEKHSVPPLIIVINIPRSSKDFISYTGIEEVKDGLFFSPKYESDMCIFNSPHIFVFGNDEPNYEKMSRDRWCVIEIE